MMKIAVITNMPVHHQVDLFDEVTKRGNIDLQVIYLRRMSYGRLWKPQSTFHHHARFLPEIRIWRHWYLNPGALKLFASLDVDGAVICQYASPAMQLAMYIFGFRGIPQTFWSESIEGIQYQEARLLPSESLRRLARRLAIEPIRRWALGCWGVGAKAIQSFEHSTLRSLPRDHLIYTSDLSPFLNLPYRTTDGKISFAFLGSLTVRKGFDLVVEATEHLISAEACNFEVQVFGTGPLDKLVDGELSQYIHLNGFVPRERIPHCLAKCHVLLFPSRYDGWGMALVEGMAAGMPVISTYESGAALDLIKDSVNGWLLESLSAIELAEKMHGFIRGYDQQYPDMTREARASVDICDVDRGAAQFELLCEKYFG